MKTKYRVIDDAFNKANYPDLIGKTFDTPPAYAKVELVKDQKPMREIFNKQEKLFLEDNAETMLEDFIYKCMREGYTEKEIINGLSEFYHQHPSSGKGIFDRAIVKKMGYKDKKDKKASNDSWYKKAQNITQNSNEYTAKVKIKAREYGPNNDWEAEIDNISYFKYKIEIDYRSWGIKDINVSFPDILKETMLVSYFNDAGDEIKREDRPITIEMSKIPVEYVKGSGIYVVDVEIELNKDLTVDYNNSHITVAVGVL